MTFEIMTYIPGLSDCWDVGETESAEGAFVAVTTMLREAGNRDARAQVRNLDTGELVWDGKFSDIYRVVTGGKS